MAGVQIRIEDHEIGRTLDAVDRVAADPSAIMAEISAYMVTVSQRHIELEHGPGGRKWPPLSPRTAAKRVRGRRRGHDHMLRVSGRLYQSLTGDHGRTHAAAGTNLVYAGIHQMGGTINMPARQQDIHLSTGRGSRRFVKASRKRKETRRVDVGAHTITIPPRPYLYLDEAERAEIVNIAADGFRREAPGLTGGRGSAAP